MKIDKNELRIILAAYGAKISTEDKNLANRNYYWCDDGSDDHQALISMASNGLAVHVGGQGTRLLFVFTGHAVKPLPSGGGYKAYPASLGHKSIQSLLFYAVLFGVTYGIISLC